MRTKHLPLALLLSLCSAALAAHATFRASAASPPPPPDEKQQERGGLAIVDASGKRRGSCPLKHTAVRGEISGFLSRVTVTQEFENPLKEKIEAVYAFPLPRAAAVDDMTMAVGDRTVRGKVLRREEAQAVYEAAREGGQVASLLDQERPNIFTQSVANIMPGERVSVTISYVETLKYEDGAYEFSFPMVVGPRYVPGSPVGKQGGGFAPDTDRVPDASRITPRPAGEGVAAGHDLSLELALDAGVPIDSLRSATHEIDVDRTSPSAARVRLRDGAVRPNKDFVLRYDVAGQKISDALLTHRDGRGGFFTMILQPPERVTAADVMPKELVFVLDTSGSMSGFPIEKAKEAMKHALEGLYPQDTFNLITFAGDTSILFPEPVPATPENLEKAKRFLETREGGGGTEMMKAISAALDPSDSQAHVRIVCFMTDGYVGNDMEIVGEVKKHPNARVFSFGIGGSVNRFLLDKMAEEGRGEVEYVGLNDDGSAAARRFHERVRNPLLTDIEIDWGGLPVADVYPKRIPDLFGVKPVVITGRFTRPAGGTARLRGRMQGVNFEREVNVWLPEAEPRHDVLATLWARTRVEDLMSHDYQGLQQGTMSPDVRASITSLGLEFRLMTQFTSFVAVEEMTITDGGRPRRIDVPVELPEGVSEAAVPMAAAEFGVQARAINSLPMNGRKFTSLLKTSPSTRPAPSGGGFQVDGTPGGVMERVEVTAAEAPTIDMSSSSVSTKVYPPPKAPAPAREGRKNKAKRAGGGGGSGGGVGAGRGSGASGGDARVGGSGVGGAGAAGQPAAAGDEDDAVRVDGRGAVTTAEQRLRTKLHASLLAVVERLKKKGAAPGAEEARFVREGKAEVQVWLTEKTDEVLAELRALGLEVLLDPKTSKVVIGRLPVEKLSALAELKAVRYVAPQAIQ